MKFSIAYDVHKDFKADLSEFKRIQPDSIGSTGFNRIEAHSTRLNWIEWIQSDPTGLNRFNRIQPDSSGFNRVEAGSTGLNWIQLDSIGSTGFKRRYHLKQCQKCRKS